MSWQKMGALKRYDVNFLLDTEYMQMVLSRQGGFFSTMLLPSVIFLVHENEIRVGYLKPGYILYGLIF